MENSFGSQVVLYKIGSKYQIWDGSKSISAHARSQYILNGVLITYVDVSVPKSLHKDARLRLSEAVDSIYNRNPLISLEDLCHVLTSWGFQVGEINSYNIPKHVLGYPIEELHKLAEKTPEVATLLDNADDPFFKEILDILVDAERVSEKTKEVLDRARKGSP